MTYRPAVPPSRTVRTVAATAIASSLALCAGLIGGSAAAAAGAPTPSSAPATSATSATPPATGSGAGGSPSVSSLQVQAQELAGEIDADGRQLDQLSAAYQAARMRYQQISTQEAATRRAMAGTTAAVAVARHNLRQQALLAYLTGGSPLISYIPDRPGLDPSLTTSYAEIISGSERDAVEAYRATLAEQGRQAAQLAAEASQADTVLAAARADAGQAQATLASRQAALAQVTGQLAVAVAAVQASQQQAEAATVRARLASEGQLPSGPAPARPLTAGTAAGPRPGAGGSSGPVAPTPVATTPVTAAPRVAPAPAAPPATTAPPATAPAAGPATTGPATTGPATTGPPPTTTPAPAPSGSVPPQAPGASQALAYARAQLGKPYQWGGAGPDSFDCSGLVMMAWAQGGVSFPHLAQDQYDMTARIPLSQLLPGDLVFFGTPSDVYHVGIYIGNGQMIDAPETGQDVSVQSIYWDSLLGGGRVHT